MKRFFTTGASRFLLASVVSFVSLAFANSSAYACDLCAVFNAIETQRGGSKGSAYIGLADQFTLRESGIKPPEFDDLKDQYLRSNVLQVYGGYWINDRIGLQTNIPLIHRSYRRIQGGENERGSERGLGDISALVKAVPYRLLREDVVVHTEIFGGVKFPTGDSDRLEEELQEVINIITGGPINVGNLVGGDDLALGSGSTDFFGGFGVFTRYEDWVLSGNMQLSYRQEGDFEYRYGNDIQWDIGPSYYAWLEHDKTLLVRLRLSGEYKQEDEILGVEIGGSDERNIFLGPELIYTGGAHFSARGAVEFPLATESAATQVVPRYRILVSIAWSF